MPNRWAVANGNWSSAATWSGSLIPTASDDVFANNFTVNVDTSFQVLSIRNTASASAVAAGGTFNFNSGSISGSITSTVSLASNNSITVTATTGTVTISAPNASFVAGGGGIFQIINHSGNCNLTINANNFSGASTSGANCILKSSTGTLTITGSMSGGSIANSYALSSTTGDTSVLGNIVGSTGNAILQSAGTLTVIGSITGAAASGISFSGTSLNINGNLIATTSAAAVSCTSATTINISGSITPSSVSPGLPLSGASTLTYSGSIASSAGSPAIISSNASATNIFTGPFINTNDTMAVQCVDMNLTANASTTWNFGNITLFSPERLAFYPSASDIRQGTTYADGTVSGSLAMPPPSAVVAGTPTDNTTGSAVLTPAQLQDAVWGRDLSQMTETGSIGNRLARVSTTGTTGAQIASYLL